MGLLGLSLFLFWGPSQNWSLQYIYIYIYIKKERDEGNKVDVYAREKDEREVSGSSCGGLDIT